MRRDICKFYPKAVHEVFDAYVAAARDRFDKECDAKPYYSITFGLNFSFKYNMNGGACTVHFMPCNGGTAVNSRYSIAQGVGARYEAHNRDLTKVVESRLGCSAQGANIDVEEFLKPENQVVAQPLQPAYEIAGAQTAPNNIQFTSQARQSAQPVAQPAPQPASQPMPQAVVEYGQSEQPAYEIAGAQTAPNNIQFTSQARQSAQPVAQPEVQYASQPQPMAEYAAQPAYEVVPQTQPQPAPQPEPRPVAQYGSQPEQPVYDTVPQPEGEVSFCIGCGSTLRPNAKFCSACGKPVVVEPPKCPDCGETVGAEDKFCFNCGTKLK